jgi:hypothetical protein
MVEEGEEQDKSFEKFREEQQREIDLLSLELLSNTKHYKKYIAKNNPDEQLKSVNESQRFFKYKSKIAALFIELLENYGESNESDTIVDLEHQSIFKEFVRKTIQHLEWSEYSQMDKSEFDDEDTMFAFKSGPQFNIRKKKYSKEHDPYSYWGATIRKSNTNEDEN